MERGRDHPLLGHHPLHDVRLRRDGADRENGEARLRADPLFGRSPRRRGAPLARVRGRQGGRDRRASLRGGIALSRRRQAAAPVVGEGDRLHELGADPPQVHPLPSRHHLSHPRHFQSRAHGRRRPRGIRTASRAILPPAHRRRADRRQSMTTRRRFLLTLAGGMTFGRALLAQTQKQEKGADDDLASARAAKVPNVSKAKKPLKVLLLGGTGFIGPHIVAHSIARGHTVTLFNRGKTHPELFPDLEKLRGDRDGKLDALKGRKWDAVVDTSGYVPRIVKMSADLLAPEVKQYVFISSISVYPDDVKPGANEETPVQELKKPGSEEVRKHYGALKALCERTGKEAGFSQIDCKKAIGKGLKFRSADETARDTLAWWKTLPEERRAKVRAGLSPDREKEVLAAWKAKKA